MQKVITIIAITSCVAACWWGFGRGGDSPREEQNTADSQSVQPSFHSPSASSQWENLTDHSQPWQTRVARLREMDASELSSRDIDTLYALLDFRPTQQHESWWVVMNEIMEQMRLQGIDDQRYAGALLAILKDDTAHEVMRDYAVQHIGQWITPRGAELGYPHEQKSAVIQQVIQTLVDVVIDPSLQATSVPSTTLNVLVDMHRGGADPAAMQRIYERLDPWLSSALAGESEVSQSTQLSAINHVGEISLKPYAADIRQLATNADSHPSIRLSSIATLGMIGEDQDLALLQSFAAGEPRYSYAAKAALKRLNHSISNKE